MNKPFIYLIKFYRYFISPMMASRCRFYPTCSEYALQAYQQYNVFTASYLTIKRLVRCQPLCKGGLDPIPTIEKKHG